MTEPLAPAFSWPCPECGRHVPLSVMTCRCGATRPEPAAGPPLEPALPVDAPAATRSLTALGGVVIAIGAIAAAAYWTITHPAPSPATAKAQPSRTQAAAGRAGALPLVPPVAPAEKPEPLAADAPPADATSPDEPPLPSLEDLVARTMPAVVTIQTPVGRGSGFFVTADTVLTNVHVVGTESSVLIRRPDGSTTTARVDATAPAYDIAVLKLSSPRPGQATISMGSAASARVGQDVIAIGTPLGFLQNTVSRGIVSGLRDVNGTTMVQTDAAINPGNSGGPLLDRRGIALGIVNAGYQGRDGLSFAIAIDHARALIEGRLAPPASSGASPSPYTQLAPAVPSQTDQRRANDERTYQQSLELLARRASQMDDRWRSFKAGCYSGTVAGNLDHEWFAIWDPKALLGAVAPNCDGLWSDVRRSAQAVRDDVRAANEAARQADILPGTRRDLLRKYKLDYPGWER